MNKSTKDEGTILVLLEQFEKETLPRLLEIEQRVNSGELLSDTDLMFLEKDTEEGIEIKTLVERNPEWQELYSKATVLQEKIVQKALENEKAQKS